MMLVLMAACTNELDGPEPKLSGPDQASTSPSFVCNEQLESWVDLDGEAFSPLVIDTIDKEKDFSVTLPVVTLSHSSGIDGESGSGSDTVLSSVHGQAREDGDIVWVDAGRLRFRVRPDHALAPGVYDITVENANGQVITQTDAFGVLPRPTVTAIAPDLTCVAQSDRNVTITGTGFLVRGGELPSVHIGTQAYAATSAQDCRDLPAIFGDYQLCGELSALIDDSALDAGIHQVTVLNIEPAACESLDSEDNIGFVVVDPPTVSSVIPDPICSQLGYEEIRVHGEGFIAVNGEHGEELPTVTVGNQTYTATSVAGCSSVEGASNPSAQTCTELTFGIASGDHQAALSGDDLFAHVSVVVTNPDPVGCESTEEVSLTVVPSPEVTEVAENPTCADGSEISLVVSGRGFLKIGDELPQVQIGEAIYDALSVDDCETVEGPEAATQSCTEVHVTIPAGELTEAGEYDVIIINPAPAACPSSTLATLWVLGPPNISTVDPAAICGDAAFDGAVTLTGDMFLQVGEEWPSVEVNGVAVNVDALTGCESLDHPTLDIQSCTELTLVIPEALRVVDMDISIVNPAPADCGEASYAILYTLPPDVQVVTPLRVCNAGGTIQLDGDNFQDGMTVSLGDQVAGDVVVDQNGTRAVATFDGGLAAGLHDVIVTNPTGCTYTHDEQVRVVTGPRPFFVDPSVTYNQMATQVTIYSSGLHGGTVAEVILIDPNGLEIPLSFSVDMDRPNTVQAIIPANSLPEGMEIGEFGLQLTDDVNCSEMTHGLVTITDILSVAVADIAPPFGGKDETTGVVVTAADPAPENHTQFVATPRVYLNPSSPEAGDLARELRGLQFIDEVQLNGLVTSGLRVGDYDVIVVNPDGTVGVLEEAFEVTENPPPFIDSVTPGSWSNQETTLAVTVEGVNFSTPEVEVYCSNGTTTKTPNNITVTGSTSTSISLTIDSSNLDHLSVCYIRVTNDDGTWGEYAPISAINPAGNFVQFQQAPASSNLLEARRAPVAFSGLPARTSRFIYAIGGDDGTPANAKMTGEYAALDRFGAPQTWMSLPYDLPEGRTLSQGVRINDFVYLVGGHDGTGPTAEVHRALVLDPLDVPRVTNLEFDIDESTDPDGLDVGVYYYRVAAVLSTNDPANPGGETLASDPQPVRIPFEGITLTLSWTGPPSGATVEEYRVYRSLVADDAYGTESLIASLPGATTSFIDDGSETPLAGAEPLRLGMLGMWHHVADLNTARHSHGVSVATDPEEDLEAASTHYIYAVGGHDGAVRLADYEFLTVDVVGPRIQAVGALATEGGTNNISSAREQLAVVTAHSQNTAGITEPNIIALGGMSNTAQNQTRIDIATVLPGGMLSPWREQGGGMQIYRSGYGSAVANSNLVVAGGHNAGPSANADKSGITCVTGDCEQAALSGSSSLSNVNMRARYLMGYVSTGGLFYMIGGYSGASTISDTVDYSVLGGTL
ncbi:MAG: hypothetical protein ACNA8W_11570 [Bradymonadaceae bacterium]